MSLPIDRIAGPLSALALAAVLGASSCSASDQRLATITLDANAPEVTPPCVPQIREAHDVGLDLYFVLDHSGNDDSDLFAWNAIAFLGLASVFDQIEFRGMGVGFAIYPAFEPPFPGCLEVCGTAPSCGCLERCGCEDWHDDRQLGFCRCDEWQTSCDEAEYVPSFEIEPLTSEGRHQQALLSIPAPVGLPTLNPALLGSLRYRNAWEKDHQRRRITQVLVVTAPFTICSNRISDSEKVLSGPDKPKTYVVTVGQDDDDYDGLAIAGRTGAAIRLEVNTPPRAVPLPQALINLVKQIRATDGRCEYLLPANADFDYRKVNFSGTRDGAPLQYVGDVSGCALLPQGWYYDDPDHPTRILTCEGTCKTLHEPTNPTPSSAFIQLGCPMMSDAGR